MHTLKIRNGDIYLDEMRIQGVKKFSLEGEQEELSILKMEIFLKPILGSKMRVDEVSYNACSDFQQNSQ